MSARYFIENGQTVSQAMGLDFSGALVSFLFYDAGGLPVAVAGLPTVSRSLYDSGDVFMGIYPLATNEWRFNGPASRVKIDLTGVTGYTTYRVIIWRTNDPLDMTPDGAFSGLRAIITQPYTEANVKNGLQFYARAVWPIGDEIATLTSRKLWFRTNAKPVIVKLREFQYIAEELKIQLFIGPTGVTGGTNLTIHNYNGVGAVATTVQAKKNVTITSNGTEFDAGDPEHFFGSTTQPQRSVAVALQGRERIIAANTEFAIVITNTGTGSARVQYLLDFYEGGTDLPIKAQ